MGIIQKLKRGGFEHWISQLETLRDVKNSKLSRVKLHRITMFSNKRCPNKIEFEQNM